MEDGRTETPWKSWAHSRGEGKDHGGFSPQYRRKVLYAEVRGSLGALFHELAKQKEGRIVAGPLLPDHVPRCSESPPKDAVASGIGFLRGQSALALARPCGGKLRNFTGEHCWARGYAVSTVGYELEAVKRYIRDQDENDKSGRF